MRALLVRMAAWFAPALLAAASADATSEFAENAGWLGGSARDGHQEAILPVLLLGVAIALALAGYVACARMTAGDLSVLRACTLRTYVFDVSIALAGSLLCVLAMEGYETRFGGVSPFESGSVVVSHLPLLLAAFTIVTLVVKSAMRELLRAAERAGTRMASALGEFVRKLLLLATGLRGSHRFGYSLCVLHLPNPVDGGGYALRAPPGKLGSTSSSLSFLEYACEVSFSRFAPSWCLRSLPAPLVSPPS